MGESQRPRIWRSSRSAGQPQGNFNTPPPWRNAAALGQPTRVTGGRSRNPPARCRGVASQAEKIPNLHGAVRDPRSNPACMVCRDGPATEARHSDLPIKEDQWSRHRSPAGAARLDDQADDPEGQCSDRHGVTSSFVLPVQPHPASHRRACCLASFLHVTFGATTCGFARKERGESFQTPAAPMIEIERGVQQFSIPPDLTRSTNEVMSTERDATP